MDRVSGGSLPAALWGRVVARTFQGAAPQPLPGGGTALDAPGGAPGGADEGVGGLISRVLRALGQGGDATPRPRADTSFPPQGDER
jgi:hypothetical protein